MVESTKTKQLVYTTLTIDLSAANTDTEYKLPGIFDNLGVISLTGSVSIRINERTRDLLDLSVLRVINVSAMDRIYVTNTAQAGATLVLALGAEASFGVGTAGIRPAAFLKFCAGYTGGVSQATTNAYAILGVAMPWTGIDKANIELSETAGQDVKYKIEASTEGTYWVTLKTDVFLAASTTAFETISDLWYYVRVSITDNVGGVHGSVVGTVVGKSLL